MRPDLAISTAAELLVAARRQRRRIERLPESCRPQTRAAGYAVQQRVAADLGVTGGWKIGADHAEATPLYAPIIASDIFPSGASLAAQEFPAALIEAEIAFRMRRDLPLRAQAYDYESVAAAVEMLPVFEINGSRYQNPSDVTDAEQLADCLANCGLVFGTAAASPRATDSSWTIELNIDGRVERVSSKRHPVGDPLRLVVWLANHLAAQGGGLQTGQIVTTGALVLGPAGKSISGQWHGLGSVSVSFT
jgi:2-keto-4-pentenoate hydratase